MLLIQINTTHAILEDLIKLKFTDICEQSHFIFE
jgi:hypothetical protein